MRSRMAWLSFKGQAPRAGPGRCAHTLASSPGTWWEEGSEGPAAHYADDMRGGVKEGSCRKQSCNAMGRSD